MCNRIAICYVFYQCKHIGSPTCTQHLLTPSARRPNDDHLKRSKHVASYILKSFYLTYINLCFSISLEHRDVFHQITRKMDLHICTVHE